MNAPTPADALVVDRLDAADTRFANALTKRRLRAPLAGNAVTLLQNGPQTHRAQLQAIAAARHHVHLETYLITDGEIGCRYADALIERARAGVVVRLMLDGLGAWGAGEDFRRRLLEAGVQIREFNPVNPFKQPQLWRATRRTHRKTLVVDGRVAFTGGINITDDYRAEPDGSAQGGWRDTHVRIAGPAASEFQRVFLAYWARLGGIDDTRDYFPKLSAAGDTPACALTDQGEGFIDLWLDGHDADRDLLKPHNPLRPKYRQSPRIYRAYLDAIHLSRERIRITQAYFAPNGRFIRALIRAARRGVNVQLILPGITDAGLLKYAARQRYSRLMRAGVEIHEYQGNVLHAKTAVIDGRWSTVGSANLDYRSFFHNDEANAFFVCGRLGARMDAVFEDDLRRSHRIEPARWKTRGWKSRLLEAFAGSIRWLL